MKKISISIIAVITISFTACSSKKNTKENNAPAKRNTTIKVQGFVAQSRTLNESIEVPGNLLPNESTELHPEVSGRVTALYFKEGSFVKKGTLLAKLFDGDLQAQVKKLEVQQGIAETTAERYSKLVSIGGISQQDYDLSKLEINNIKADIGLLKTDIARTAIYAPYDGKIGLRAISPGAYVTPATIIATIQQVHQLKLEFTVPETYISKISNGQLVKFTIDGSNKTFSAKVIATEASVAATNRSLTVRALINANKGELVPGIFAKVTIDLGKDDQAILVPSQAVIPQARSKQVILYKQGVAHFTEVSTNIRDSAMVQITKGLQAGDTVVITGLLAIKPGSKLELSGIVKDTLTK